MTTNTKNSAEIIAINNGIKLKTITYFRNAKKIVFSCRVNYVKIIIYFLANRQISN
jgi:hypothetical protein